MGLLVRIVLLTIVPLVWMLLQYVMPATVDSIWQMTRLVVSDVHPIVSNVKVRIHVKNARMDFSNQNCRKLRIKLQIKMMKMKFVRLAMQIVGLVWVLTIFVPVVSLSFSRMELDV